MELGEEVLGGTFLGQDLRFIDISLAHHLGVSLRVVLKLSPVVIIVPVQLLLGAAQAAVAVTPVLLLLLLFLLVMAVVVVAIVTRQGGVVVRLGRWGGAPADRQGALGAARLLHQLLGVLRRGRRAVHVFHRLEHGEHIARRLRRRKLLLLLRVRVLARHDVITLHVTVAVSIVTVVMIVIVMRHDVTVLDVVAADVMITAGVSGDVLGPRVVASLE